MLWLFRSLRPAWPLIWIHCHYICVDIYMSNSQQRLIWCYDPCKLKFTEQATNKTKNNLNHGVQAEDLQWAGKHRGWGLWSHLAQSGLHLCSGLPCQRQEISCESEQGPLVCLVSLSLFSMWYPIFFLKKYLSFPINSCDLHPRPVLQKNEPFCGYLFWLIYLLLRRFFREEVKQGPRARV